MSVTNLQFVASAVEAELQLPQEEESEILEKLFHAQQPNVDEDGFWLSSDEEAEEPTAARARDTEKVRSSPHRTAVGAGEVPPALSW